MIAVTSTTRPVTRIFSCTVFAARFQGWNSLANPRTTMNSAASPAIAASGQRTASPVCTSTTAIVATIPSAPMIPSGGTRRPSSMTPATIANGILMRTTTAVCVGETSPMPA